MIKWVTEAPGSPNPGFSFFSSPADGVHSYDFKYDHGTEDPHSPASLSISCIRDLCLETSTETPLVQNGPFESPVTYPHSASSQLSPLHGVRASFQLITRKTKQSFWVACAVGSPHKTPAVFCPHRSYGHHPLPPEPLQWPVYALPSCLLTPSSPFS